MSVRKKQSFKVRLEAKGPRGAWTFISIPFDVATVFGSRARVAVAGTINGFSFHNSLLPDGDGSHSMMVGKELQAGANAHAGDLVAVVLWKDEVQRTLAAPEDLEVALAQNPAAQAVFAGLTYSQTKEYADWINAAKRAPTRATRIGKAVAMLMEGRKRTR
jgi:hypothetical protein